MLTNIFNKLKTVSKKIPYSIIGLGFWLTTCMIAGITGMLVIPAMLSMIFISPWGIVFGVLDIVIRKKKLLPIICICLCGEQFLGVIFMVIAALTGIINTI